MDTPAANIMASLARLEEAVTGCRSDIRENHAVSVKRLDNHGDRMASLERSRAKLAGAGKVLAVISAAAGSVLAWVKLGN